VRTTERLLVFFQTPNEEEGIAECPCGSRTFYIVGQFLEGYHNCRLEAVCKVCKERMAMGFACPAGVETGEGCKYYGNKKQG